MELKGLKQTTREQALISDGWQPEQVAKAKEMIDALKAKGYQADYNINVEGNSTHHATSLSVRFNGASGVGGTLHFENRDLIDTLKDLSKGKEKDT